MRIHVRSIVVGCGFASWLLVATSFGQQVQLTTPFHSQNESFYENFGVGLGGINRMGPRGGWFFSGLPANATLPPFGGYDPGADARFGFRAGPFDVNLIAGQGSTRSMVMESPTLVVPHGGTGYLFEGSQRPFVTGVVPVVGHPVLRPVLDQADYPVHPLTERLQRFAGESAAAARRDQLPQGAPARASRDPSPHARQDDPPLVLRGGRSSPASSQAAVNPGDSTATRGDLSLREIRQQQAEEEAAGEHEVRLLIEKARGQEAAGKQGLAKIYYQQAAARAAGQLRQQLQAKIDSL